MIRTPELRNRTPYGQSRRKSGRVIQVFNEDELDEVEIRADMFRTSTPRIPNEALEVFPFDANSRPSSRTWRPTIPETPTFARPTQSWLRKLGQPEQQEGVRKKGFQEKADDGRKMEFRNRLSKPKILESHK